MRIRGETVCMWGYKGWQGRAGGDLSAEALNAAPELPGSRTPTCQRNNISVLNFASNTA